jgi:peptidoglycan hydrolase-like protein with peptidoglycan-binding domain
VHPRARRLPRRLATVRSWPAALVAVLVLVLATTGVAAAASFPHTSHGNRGVNVKALQHLLRQHGATIEVTALYDNVSVAAVRSFQWGHGLPGTGQVDARTWAALIVTLRSGSKGEAVLAAQRLLNEKRHAGLALTGVYDAPTRAAVLAFQGHAGIGKTGDVGPVTWTALTAHFELPVWGRTLCDYSVGNGAANWGTASAIGQLQAAAHVVVDAGYGRIALGDIGFEHGGPIPGHQTHERGMDVDIRPMRDANDQCRWGTNWRLASYDRAATRALVKAIRATALGHVKLVYFNDPVLIREGLTTALKGHDDHLHIRYCEWVYPVAAYDC